MTTVLVIACIPLLSGLALGAGMGVAHLLSHLQSKRFDQRDSVNEAGDQEIGRASCRERV